jgi:hypothetical protein
MPWACRIRSLGRRNDCFFFLEKEFGFFFFEMRIWMFWWVGNPSQVKDELTDQCVSQPDALNIFIALFFFCWLKVLEILTFFFKKMIHWSVKLLICFSHSCEKDFQNSFIKSCL